MSARLVADRVTLRRADRTLLDRVTTQLAPGALVALVGPNGSGKSTLLRALLGAEAIDGGSIQLDDRPLATVAARDRAKLLTMVTHGLAVDFGVTARDLVALGRLPHRSRFGGETLADRDAIDRALAAVDAAHLADRSFSTLSAGEKQRIGLARALAQEARLLLLDEPTANLDLRHQLEAIDVLRAFVDRGGGAMVAIHDLSLVIRAFDRVLLLDRGAVVDDGPPQRVLTEDRLADVFGVEAHVVRDGDRTVRIDVERAVPKGHESA